MQVTNKFVFILLTLIVVCIDVIGDYLAKKWALSSKSVYFIVSLVLFTIANVFWLYSMKFEILSKIMIFYSVLGVVAGVLIGILIFQEKMSVVNWVGFGLALISLVMVNM